MAIDIQLTIAHSHDMKIPQPPPSLDELLKALPPERLSTIISLGRPTVDGSYLHWDQLRHREPPGGLSVREWWLATKGARLSGREVVPLIDKSGEPFSLVYVPAVLQGLHKIDQSLGMSSADARAGNDVGSLVDAHGRNYLLATSLMEEAIRSSQLEGASTTRAKAKDMIRERREPTDKSERMILNNFHGMERIEELARRPLSQDAIFELHRILVDGTLEEPSKAGVLRIARDNVVVELLHSIETAHVPPRADELGSRLETLVAFANGETPEDWLHPVLRATILHFMIGYDHPFVDGNGRVARALFYWAMLRHGYPLAKFLSISRVLRGAPAKYARAYLFTETDGGDLTYFVDHQIQVILQSIEGLAQYVSTKIKSTQRLEAELQDYPSINHRQLRLIGHALRHPGFEYTVQSHQTSHRVVTNTARADLVDLAEQGLLLRSKEGRRHVFIAPRDLEARLGSLRTA